MASTSQKWLIGCGAGCGVMLLLCGLLAGGGYFLVNRIISNVQETKSSLETLESQFGRISDFVPDPDGSVPRSRLEVFLEIREQMSSERREMEAHLGLLAEGHAKKLTVSPLKMLKLVRAGAATLPLIFKYLNRRNELSIDYGMGLGEYLYLYAIIYYSWLQKSPADGPPFTLLGSDDDDEEDEDERGFKIRMDRSDRDDSEDEVRQRRRQRTLRYLNRQLLAMLRRQLDHVSARTGNSGTTDWRQTLVAEIQLLASDPFRLPWQDGLPPRLEDSLRPYRTQFEASYSSLCNSLELAPYQDD